MNKVFKNGDNSKYGGSNMKIVLFLLAGVTTFIIINTLALCKAASKADKYFDKFK